MTLLDAGVDDDNANAELNISARENTDWIGFATPLRGRRVTDEAADGR